MKKILNLFLLVLGAGLLMGIAQYADPTRPTTVTNSGYVNNWVLTEIKSGPYYPHALINNQLVKVGDKIGDYTISTISENTVELIDSEKNKETLNLVKKVKQVRKQGDKH